MGTRRLHTVATSGFLCQWLFPRGGVAAVVLVLLTVFHVAPPAWGEDSLLSTKRWREHSYGVSLKPPLGSRLVSQTVDDAVVRIYGQGGYSIRVYIKKSTVDVSIQDVVPKAIHQLGGVYPSAVILEQKPIEVSDLSGAVIYFQISDPRRGNWVIGQAFVQLDKRTLVMLQLEVAHHQFAATSKIYEAVIDSLEVENPQQLNQRRATQIGLGERWRETIDVEQRKRAIQPQQWLRIVENDTDIGYMHIQQKADTAMKYDGVRVDIQSRIHLGDNVYDSISNFFASNDGSQELWSIRTTVRALTPPTGTPANTSWAETGVRSNDKVSVSLERPSGIDEHHWQKPLKGYLSQVEVHMMDCLLGPVDDVEEMGFYAYHPGSQKIVYRTTRVEKDQDGSFTIHTRSSPEQEEHVTHYSADGRFIKRVLPGGRVILPATRQQLQLKWKIR